MIDLDDPRAAAVADVMTNETSKKILRALVERELSASEISELLKSPLNTVSYNIEKLRAAGLIEIVQQTLWSVKGKRIQKYRISNTKIVISPKTKLRGVVPAVILSAVAASIVWLHEVRTHPVESSFMQKAARASDLSDYAFDAARESAGNAAPASQANSSWITSLLHLPNAPAWFFIGALTALFIFVVWNWGKR